MPLQKTNTGNIIPGIFPLNATQRQDCHKAIGQIVFADLGRGPGTLHISGCARVDVQSVSPRGVDLNVQIAGSSVAAALVALTVLQITDPVNQVGGANGAISVLEQSLDTGTIWHLDGTLP
ncbi:hypothetical protein K9F62_01915 [Desulfovibrio sp. JY]|nr:hypothetical protein K9F62_01915 [Desulfovibrio sp. JY]